ncbi:hypothetical protein B1756_06785 [Natrarchaeobaculum aegyptiacum]|uniref:Halobacterial output domain-containing protein n=2 Tax=Natrarchaeobaculum aegyptiacum TaxID=745377 RepID=A0A2Z2I398_9EURY|nr:HalOD1 output domain-containing protein [Natrarchaeobaculum aegyptiacum]ARS91718.1 hypothetical protein B1756_06785 [Natrarchaeobaculum aegyptiacum]
MAVVNAVAARRNVDPLELPPLYDWIDPEALDALFDPPEEAANRRLEFVYDGHLVTVEGSDCTILVDGTPVTGDFEYVELGDE